MSSSNPTLPEDLIVEVLLRTHVKSVLRFRSVSRSWRAIIDSLEFISKHSDLSTKIGTSESKIIVAKDSQLYTINDMDSVSGAKTQKMKCPLSGSFFLVGSCQSVICLGYPSGQSQLRFLLWNPSRGDCRTVDDSADEPTGACRFVRVEYCFGYDHIKDDHKLVKIISKCRTVPRIEFDFDIEIYSLRSNSWKKSFSYPDRPSRYFDCRCVFVDGTNAIHFMAIENSESSFVVGMGISAFDLESESFSNVPLPVSVPYGDSHIDGYWNLKALASLDGCLCFCNDFQHSTDVWVMKNYGIIESWVRLLSFRRDFVENICLPITYSDSRRTLLLASTKELKTFSVEEENKSDELWEGIPDIFFRHIVIPAESPRSIVDELSEHISVSGMLEASFDPGTSSRPTMSSTGKIKCCVCSTFLVPTL